MAPATFLPVLKFNVGDICFPKILNDLDIEPRVLTRKGAEAILQQKAKDKINMRRKTLRHLRAKYIDHAKDNEGVTYEGGAF